MDVEETDLYKVLEEHQDLKIGLNHLTIIMYNMLCSLNYIHSANLIHRDIKPSNFLMNFDCVPKLCDFGLARSMPKNDHDFYFESISTNDNSNQII